MKEMEFQETLDLVFKLDGKIDFLWNFYVGINVVVIGWLLARKERGNLKLKAVLTIVYLLFVGMNLRAILENYAFLNAATEELKLIANTVTFKGDELKEIIQQKSYSDRLTFAWGIHLVVDSLILVAIWNDRLWKKISY